MDSVIYNGQSIPKQHFRVFLFNNDGNKILVNSWDEYQSLIASGEWVETLPPPIEHTNSSRKKISKNPRNKQSVSSGVKIIDENSQEIILV